MTKINSYAIQSVDVNESGQAEVNGILYLRNFMEEKQVSTPVATLAAMVRLEYEKRRLNKY